ncbi:MAG: glutamate-5-semialdehyde dehydrogenase [Deltaproteobacteria bacterium]|nr:glutamate-5-semialdehyde dehydrogenase [Deltaproteobacteria bacterium]
MTSENPALTDLIRQTSSSAKVVACSLLPERNLFLRNLAQAVDDGQKEILAANELDLAEGKKQGLGEAVVDRLKLDEGRLRQLSGGLRDSLALPDPLGGTENVATLASGLVVGRRRTSLGTIFFICEARPGAVVEAAAMAVKSGNALIAKPGRDSRETSSVFGRLISEALSAASLPPETVLVLPSLSGEDIKRVLSMSDLIDLVIPRGGESLISFVDQNSRIPVLKHYKGVNHLYVDAKADLEMAVSLTVNGKCNRPSTCNALECLLTHESAAPAFLPTVSRALSEKKVRLLGCPKSRALVPSMEPAADDDFGREFLDLTLAVKIVENMEEALKHIETFGSRHTEVICTEELGQADEFVKRVDASCVMVNASPRLNDGGCLGLGAEIGISTSKLHAYGPMGLRELTTTKFVVLGRGHLRS